MWKKDEKKRAKASHSVGCPEWQRFNEVVQKSFNHVTVCEGCVRERRPAQGLPCQGGSNVVFSHKANSGLHRF